MPTAISKEETVGDAALGVPHKNAEIQGEKQIRLGFLHTGLHGCGGYETFPTDKIYME